MSPDTLIPNRFLRNSVNNFKNQTGYIRAPAVTRPPARPKQSPHLHGQQSSSSLVAIHVADELPPTKPTQLPFTPASPDIKEPIVTPDGMYKYNDSLLSACSIETLKVLL